MDTAKENILVVPELEPRIKHATIFARFDALKKGESLTIINDHDPKPLYYQLQSQHGDTFDWEYLQDGPDEWRIKITQKENRIEILNATLLEPMIKHQTIFEKFDSLQPGEAFVLLNDHDPVPLYHQLMATRGEVFSWQYIRKGPYEFRILITKKPAEKSAAQANGNGSEDVNVIDVPSLEPRLKHPTIFRKFDDLRPGEKLTIHNDHDPKPLFYQLQAEHGDIFTWKYLEEGPAMWRILIEKKKEDVLHEETLGDIVAKDFSKADVFNKYGLDFCCDGKKTVKEACAEKGVDVAVVEKELQQGSNATSHAQRPLPYNDWSLDFLADYIVNTHHNYQKRVMPDLKSFSEKVMKVHGAHHPELIEINRLVQETLAEIVEHNAEEENVLFPYIKRLVAQNGRAKDENYHSVKEPIDLRVREHELVGGNMHKIRDLSNHYALPDDACASYTFLYKTLDEFEEDLHVHIHLENNILFPKALRLEKEGKV